MPRNRCRDVDTLGNYVTWIQSEHSHIGNLHRLGWEYLSCTYQSSQIALWLWSFHIIIPLGQAAKLTSQSPKLQNYLLELCLHLQRLSSMRCRRLKQVNRVYQLVGRNQCRPAGPSPSGHGSFCRGFNAAANILCTVWWWMSWLPILYLPDAPHGCDAVPSTWRACCC